MTKIETYAAVGSTFADAVRSVPGLGSYVARGAGYLTIADRVLAANPAASVAEINAAIVADRQAAADSDSRKIKRAKGPAKAQAKLNAELADLRDTAVRALTTEAELAR